MAETIAVFQGTKEEQYRHLLPQIAALLEQESDLIANLANVCAALKEQFDWFWVGFYLVRKDLLIVGPFQGPVACTRISFGRGVCGTCWAERKTIIVDDVRLFPGHIACNDTSRSEIVVPVIREDAVKAVLDIDSRATASFDETDKQYLEQLLHLLPF